nr:toxin C-terminal domain-containing protein [Treponema sp. OMZ 857]
MPAYFQKLEETGVNYYGARYLDPKYSRWLSGDPALSEYIPKTPIDDETKKHNENLPGMGGVYNVVNLHLYYYAGIGQRSDSELQANNPVKYTDPDGKSEELGSDASDHLLVRKTDDGKHVIIDGGNRYNYVEQALINYINTGDEIYLNQVPKTSDPLAVAGISAFIADYLDNNDTNSNSIGSKSETIFAIAIAVAGSSGGNRDAHNRPFASTKEATAVAAKLGFSKTNYFSEREPVYKKGHLYITPDRTSHNGGVWKMADSVASLKQRSTRMGTYDANLNRIGD